MTTRVVALSDTHLAREPVTTADGPDARLVAAVDAVLSDVRDGSWGDPDLVLLPGDVADDGSADAYARVRQHLEPLRAPVVAIAGNHDLVDVVADAFGAHVETDLGVWRVVSVDSVIPEEIHGRSTADEVTAALGPDTGRPTMLVLHHPPISVSSHAWFTLDGADEVVAALCARNDVRVVVSGHLHQRFSLMLDGVTYVGCPSTWYAIEHHGDEMAFRQGDPGFVEFDLEDDGRFTWRWRTTS